MTTSRVKQNRKTQSGYSLVELIVYIAILSIITTGLIRVVLVINETSSYLRAQERIAYSATIALEAMTREIRKANTIDVFSSNFGTSSGVLVLDTSVGGIPSEVTFSLVGNRIEKEYSTGVTSPLTASTVYVEDLTFKRVTNVNTEGILVHTTLSHQSTSGTTTKEFQTFVVLDI